MNARIRNKIMLRLNEELDHMADALPLRESIVEDLELMSGPTKRILYYKLLDIEAKYQNWKRGSTAPKPMASTEISKNRMADFKAELTELKKLTKATLQREYEEFETNESMRKKKTATKPKRKIIKKKCGCK